MYDIIVFENVHFRPSRRKREACVFRHLHSAIFYSVFFLLQWKILVTFTNFGAVCNSYWVCYSWCICHFFYTFLRAVSLKRFLSKLLPRFAGQFLLQLAILVKFVVLAIFSISSIHFWKPAFLMPGNVEQVWTEGWNGEKIWGFQNIRIRVHVLM